MTASVTPTAARCATPRVPRAAPYTTTWDTAELTGGKSRLGAISRMGNGYLRRMLVVYATSVVRRGATNDTSTGPWLRGLLARKPVRLVTVAVANKTARIAWTLMARGGTYQAHLGA